MTILDDDEDESPFEDEVALFASAFADLEKRCKAANISVIRRQEPEQPLLEANDTYATVQLPSGRETRSIPFWSHETIRRFLAIEFEKYVFLPGYEAICSYEYGTIECLTRPIDRIPTGSIWRKIFGERRAETETPESELAIVVRSDDHPSVCLAIRQSSEELRVLSRGLRSRPGLSFRVTGATISRHDEALVLLTKLSNAFFFQLEMSYGISLSLERERTPLLRKRLRPIRQKPEDMQFPRQEYDEAPISLYWYGCSAVGMPLLQFLAFYQVLEYYFPTYSQAEAKRRICNILKNPLFRPDRDSDIGRLLSTIASRGSGTGDERSQLRATLNECINPEQLRIFLTQDQVMSEFFQKKKGLGAHKLPIANLTADLRNDVAERIYDIRCKIVHTKGDGAQSGTELLLPFSKEAAELYYDIDLLRFLAREVLITASSPLKL
jgi:hypothetical protein